MDWLTNLAKSTGIGGNVALALSIVALFAWLDKVINKDRKSEILRFLKSPPNGLTTQNSEGRIILSLFEVVFGKKHFTWKCFLRSALATSFQLATLVVVLGRTNLGSSFELENHPVFNPETKFYDLLLLTPRILLVSVIADYFSLFKGRLILKWLAKVSSALTVPLGIFLDVVLSQLISGILIFGYGYVFLLLVDQSFDLKTTNFPDVNYSEIRFLGIAIICGYSTLVTSIWSILVGGAVATLRLLVSLKYLARFTSYVFDVDAAPVASIGRVVALIVWIGSVVVQHI